MKSYLKIFLLAYLLLLNKANAQSLWELGVSTFDIIGVKGDTTLANLYNILQTDSLKYTLEFKSAALLLAVYDGQTAKDFILERINYWIDQNDQFFNWNDYFSYQLIKGYFGESSAILGMDSIVEYSNNPSLQINAISYLVEAGQFNYFGLVKDIFNNQKFTISGISLLSQYGFNPVFREEVINLLSGVVRDSSDYYKVTYAARNLAELDKDYTVELLEQRFFESVGYIRYNYFKELDILNPQNQMERSIWVIPKELDDELRSDYIPFLFEGDPDLSMRGYLSPRWINFIMDWLNVETYNVALFHIHSSLEDFQPAKPDSFIQIGDMIDSLVILADTVKSYAWLGDIQFKNELQSILQSAKTNLQNGDSLACRVKIKEFQDSVDFVYKDSLNTDPRFVTIEGWKFLYWNAQYILDRLPEPQTNPNLLVKLKNSLGNQIPASNVMYYEGSWKDAINNGDGTFTVITTKPTVSIRMFYEYANQTVNNVPAQNNTYTFTTVNAAVQLKNSSGNLIDEGTVQYYAGVWRTFGTTVNGVTYKELLPVNYSFRMTYEGGNQDKQQNLSDNQTVVFQTVNAAVQLKNSSGNLIDEGNVQYYAGAWRSFGTTVNGVAYKELLPVNYSFRMTYEYVSIDKQQNLSENPVVDFNTVLCTIKVTNANNQPLEGANTKYYSIAWRDIGLTNSSVEITIELLPKNLSFRATYNNVSRDKQQDISVNNLVEIMLNVP